MTVFDPVATPADIEILPPSIRQDELMQALLQVHQRIFQFDLNDLILYDFDNVPSQVLPHLAVDFLVTGYRGWLLAETEEDKRSLLKNAIALHKTAGTSYAIRLAMESVGFPGATVTENPPLYYDGRAHYNGREHYNGRQLGAFIVTLSPERSPVDDNQVDLIVALIETWKNARSKLIDLRIGQISLFNNKLFYDGSIHYDGRQFYSGGRSYSYSPLTILYLNKIEASGGTISSAQLDLIEAFLYASYDDGSAGTGTVASFMDAFDGDNAGIFPFIGNELAAALVPLQGNSGTNLVSNGFVDNDYIPASGLQGNGQSTLYTSILTSSVSVGDASVIVAATHQSSSNNEFIFGADDGAERFHYYKNVNNSIVGRLQGQSQLLNRGAGSDLDAVHSWVASSSEIFTAYSDFSLQGEHTTLRQEFTENAAIIVGAQSPSGSNATNAAIHLLAIANRALTDEERNIFVNAVTTYKAGRLGL